MDLTPQFVEQARRVLTESPWAIHPPALGPLIAVAHGDQPDGDPDEHGTQAANGRMRPSAGGVAVIPIHGRITPRPMGGLLGMLLGGTSVSELRSMLRGAVADDAIGSIVFDVDSPGGRVDGIPELGDEIREARGRKPIVAAANTFAASGAYWLASQADELLVAPSGQVGSIGVFTSHTDFSKMDERLGLNTTLIAAGKYKVEGNPYEPLSDEARDAMQAMVDDYYSMFVDAVAAGRDVDRDDVAGGFGQGRMVLAEAAVAEGMADDVGTLEDAIARAAGLGRTGGSPSARAGGTVTVPLNVSISADFATDDSTGGVGGGGLLPASEDGGADNDDEQEEVDVLAELAADSPSLRAALRTPDPQGDST